MLRSSALAVEKHNRAWGFARFRKDLQGNVATRWLHQRHERKAEALEQQSRAPYSCTVALHETTSAWVLRIYLTRSKDEVKHSEAKTVRRTLPESGTTYLRMALKGVW